MACKVIGSNTFHMTKINHRTFCNLLYEIKFKITMNKNDMVEATIHYIVHEIIFYRLTGQFQCIKIK